jgi:hypothetical protein
VTPEKATLPQANGMDGRAGALSATSILAVRSLIFANAGMSQHGSTAERMNKGKMKKFLVVLAESLRLTRRPPGCVKSLIKNSIGLAHFATP